MSNLQTKQLRLFQDHRELLEDFFQRFDEAEFERCLQIFSQVSGQIYFTGIGKSGLVAKQLAVLYTSLGTKAFYLSPQDAFHGDLGYISRGDLVFIMSKSGQTEELEELALCIKQKGAQLVAIVCKEKTKLHALCDHVVYLPLKKELCPFDLSPTTSTIIQLIFGNTLAVLLMQRKGFSLDSYLLNHPSGAIGKKIGLKIDDVMIKGFALPVCRGKDSIQSILVELSKKKCGSILVLNEVGSLEGIFTDGDLRRALEKKADALFSLPIELFMTRFPVVVQSGSSARSALECMEKKKISVLPVLDQDQVVGLVRLNDLIAVGIN